MKTFKFKRNGKELKAIANTEKEARARLALCFMPEAHAFFQIRTMESVRHYLTFIGTKAVDRAKFFFMANEPDPYRKTKFLATYSEIYGNIFTARKRT